MSIAAEARDGRFDAGLDLVASGHIHLARQAAGAARFDLAHHALQLAPIVAHLIEGQIPFVLAAQVRDDDVRSLLGQTQSGAAPDAVRAAGSGDDCDFSFQWLHKGSCLSLIAYRVSPQDQSRKACDRRSVIRRMCRHCSSLACTGV